MIVRAPRARRREGGRPPRATPSDWAPGAEELGNETGETVVAVVADTSDEARSRARSPRPSRALGGGIDILVNAAAEPGGYAAPPALAEIDAAHLQREIDVKVMGYLRSRVRWRNT